MATLYDLTDKYQQLLTLADEDSDAFADTLEAINDAIEDKAEGYAVVDGKLKSDEDYLASEIKRLQARKKSISNNRKRLKESLYDSMKMTGNQKIKTPNYTIWVQNNPISVNILDEDKLDKKFFEEQPDKLNKNLVKEAIENGEEVGGAELSQTEGVRIK